MPQVIAKGADRQSRWRALVESASIQIVAPMNVLAATRTGSNLGPSSIPATSTKRNCAVFAGVQSAFGRAQPIRTSPRRGCPSTPRLFFFSRPDWGKSARPKGQRARGREHVAATPQPAIRLATSVSTRGRFPLLKSALARRSTNQGSRAVGCTNIKNPLSVRLVQIVDSERTNFGYII